VSQRDLTKRLLPIIAAACGAVLSLMDVGSLEAADKPATTTDGTPFRYDSGGRRDPFVPLVRDGRLVAVTPGVPIETARPTLYGILWDAGGRSIALINEKEVTVGDAVAGYQVKAIRPDAVVLEAEGEVVELRIMFEPAAELSPDATTGGEGP